ncbi:hypothetical protein [Nitrosopumilus sp.]
MTEYSYLSSLKNKEFLILKKLCDDSLSLNSKEKLQAELEEVRTEIKKLG